jgi:glutamine synthetase
MKIGVDILPSFPKDSTDRNRTSPFAFTGNKFEFRMLGSAFSIAGPNIVLNSIVAEELSQFAEKLESAEDFTKTLNALIKKTITEHKRIIFNGNNYAEEWVREAEKRGLLNLKTTVDALPYFINEKNVKLFTKHKVFTEQEIHSRYEIQMESYCKTINIEALTMLDMVRKDIVPAVCSYLKDLTDTAVAKKAVSNDISCELEKGIISQLSTLSAILYKKAGKLEEGLIGVKYQDTIIAQGEYYRDVIVPAMEELREVADDIEAQVGEKYWPYPTYGKMLFSV